MKEYIGIKIVKAEPMYRHEAYEKGYFRKSKDQDEIPNDYGYHVIYEDGYHSWSPAEVFEKAYKSINDINITAIGMNSNDYKERFIAEYNQVCVRFNRLQHMCNVWDNEGTNKLGFTPTCPREVYNVQLKAMQDYIDVLKVRADLENINLNK